MIVTSAPPNTVTLAAAIRDRGARCIYWLQDYYPELVRGLYDYPAPLRRAFRRYWDRHLACWDKVVKIGANLGGPSAQFGRDPQLADPLVRSVSRARAQDRDLFRQPRLRTRCRTVDRGLQSAASRRLSDHDARRRTQGCATSDVVAGAASGERSGSVTRRPAPPRSTPGGSESKIRQAIFPSKIWNSIAAGRELVCTGFAGEMAEELEAAKAAPFESHLEQWSELIAAIQNRAQPSRVMPTETTLA